MKRSTLYGDNIVEFIKFCEMQLDNPINHISWSKCAIGEYAKSIGIIIPNRSGSIDLLLPVLTKGLKNCIINGTRQTLFDQLESSGSASDIQTYSDLVILYTNSITTNKDPCVFLNWS